MLAKPNAPSYINPTFMPHPVADYLTDLICTDLHQ